MACVSPLGLERAVVALCPEIEEEFSIRSTSVCDSKFLWFKLVTAILGSQVPYELAVSAAELLWKNGLIPPFDERANECEYGAQIVNSLKQPLMVGGYVRRYRFPNVKAGQIASTWHRFSKEGLSLQKIVWSGDHPKTIRSELISIVDGLGPKQASMFLRDSGVSLDLAIIDRHVLSYMTALKLTGHSKGKSMNFGQYQRLERELESYSGFLGFSLGSVDWAIWIVMRAAKKEFLA